MVTDFGDEIREIGMKIVIHLLNNGVINSFVLY
jgi:hypothetical protein